MNGGVRDLRLGCTDAAAVFGRLAWAGLWCLIAASLIASCAAAADSGCVDKTRSGAPKVPDRCTHLVGVWFKGFSLVSEGETEVIGVVLVSPATPDAGDAGAMTGHLATAPIAATFRSAREAWAVTADLARDEPVAMTWCMATYERGWAFARREPPRVDALPIPENNALPIGDPDSGIGQGTTFLTVLPPPLLERGVAVSRTRGKANSRAAVLPPDRSISVFVSWDDMEARLEPILVDGELANWWYRGFTYWTVDGPKQLSWKDPARLQGMLEHTGQVEEP